MAADIAGQYDPIKPVCVCTVVIGALGTVCRMSHNLTYTKLLNPEDFWRLAGSLQRAVLIKAVSIVKRHLARQEDGTQSEFSLKRVSEALRLADELKRLSEGRLNFVLRLLLRIQHLALSIGIQRNYKATYWRFFRGV